MSANGKIVRVEGYDSFRSFVDEWNKEKKGALFVYFSGSKDPETGASWCPDCVVAQPIVERSFNESEMPDNSTLLYVGVGPRPGWKDPSCVFRVEEPKLKCVPTLIKWGTTKRFEDDQCCDEFLVKMLFEE